MPAEPEPGHKTRDPLLAWAGGLLDLTMVLLCIGAVGIAIAMPFVVAMPERTFAEIGVRNHAPDAIGAVLLLMALVEASLVLGFFFMRHLRRIVGSVRAGDPFAPVNADRLRSMGWIAVAVQVIAIPLGAMEFYLGNLAGRHEGDVWISFGGILLALILFVLARVFRSGSDMREELEGTV